MKSIGTIKINDNQKGYLIHGQPFSLNFDFNNVKWGFVFYRAGSMSTNHNMARNYYPGSKIFGSNLHPRFFFRLIKAKDQIELISNAYYPTIKFILFPSYFNLVPNRLSIPLKINFFNTLERNINSNIDIQPNSPSVTTTKPIKPNNNHSISIEPISLVIPKIQIEILNPESTKPNLTPIHHH